MGDIFISPINIYLFLVKNQIYLKMDKILGKCGTFVNFAQKSEIVIFQPGYARLHAKKENSNSWFKRKMQKKSVFGHV